MEAQEESPAGVDLVLGKPVGLVELCYLEERPLRDEGPFLREERNLINAIAERMGLDPIEVRRRTLLRAGQTMATGQVVREGTD